MGLNFFFFFLPCRCISWKWSDCCRGMKRLYFLFEPEDVRKFATPLYTSCHLFILQGFVNFFRTPRLSLPIFQKIVSFLGSHGPDFLCLFLFPAYLVLHLFIHRSLNLATSQGKAQFLAPYFESFCLMFCFMANSVINSMEETIL